MNYLPEVTGQDLTAVAVVIGDVFLVVFQLFEKVWTVGALEVIHSRMDQLHVAPLLTSRFELKVALTRRRHMLTPAQTTTNTSNSICSQVKEYIPYSF